MTAMARRLAHLFAALLLAIGLVTAGTVAPDAVRAGGVPVTALPLAAAAATGHRPRSPSAGHRAPRRGNSPATIAFGVVVAAGFIAATIMMLRRQYGQTRRRGPTRGARRD